MVKLLVEGVIHDVLRHFKGRQANVLFKQVKDEFTLAAIKFETALFDRDGADVAIRPQGFEKFLDSPHCNFRFVEV